MIEGRSRQGDQHSICEVRAASLIFLETQNEVAGTSSDKHVPFVLPNLDHFKKTNVMTRDDGVAIMPMSPEQIDSQGWILNSCRVF